MLKWQVGQFLILVGIILLIVFVASDQIKTPEYLFFCSGIVICGLGGLVMWQGRNPPQPSERFRLFRKRGENDREKGKK